MDELSRVESSWVESSLSKNEDEQIAVRIYLTRIESINFGPWMERRIIIIIIITINIIIIQWIQFWISFLFNSILFWPTRTHHKVL
jgi:hypothetical protein